MISPARQTGRKTARATASNRTIAMSRHAEPQIASVRPAPPRDEPQGIALVLTLIFTVLLYVLVAELVVSARVQRLTGENDALLARMRNHMVYTLSQVEEQLADDLAAGAAAGEGGGAGAPLGELPGMPAPGGTAGGEEGGGEEANDADSSQDAWFEPAAYSDDDLTTYVWVEDENRKFNILTLVSPDREFAAKSKERFARLIDELRADSQYDLSVSVGFEIATAIIDWLEGRGRSQEIPRPPLKSDDETGGSQITIPMHLDELRSLRAIRDHENLFDDFVLDNELYLGLESVLTVHTSLRTDPGVPDPAAQTPGTPQTPSEGAPGTAGLPQPIGLGIRININTASRPVLRCLFDESEIPDSVIEAILRYRNEEVEEEEQESEGLTAGAEYFGDMALGEPVKKKIFKTLEDLEQIPEFQNLSNPEIKQQFMTLTSVKSDVFSVHMASMYKRSEEQKVYVMRRARSVLVRMDNAEEAELHPLILLEERHGVRVMPIDLPDEQIEFDYLNYLDELDQFAQEERRWNPFYVEFYRPPEPR